MNPRIQQFAATALTALLLPSSGFAQEGRPGQPAPVDAQAPVSVQVPAGRDWQAPPGVNLTGAFTEGFEGQPGGATGESSSGEWVLVPIPFKNALLGGGLQVGLGRLYKPVDRPEHEKTSMFGLGGMYAEGGSWAAVAADKRYWGSGRLRTTLAGGGGNVFYDINLSGLLNGLRIPVSQDFSGGMFKVGYEVRDDLWFSAGFNFSKSNLIVQGLEYEGGVDAFAPDVRIQTAAVTLEGDWDTRSDQFYPRGGWLVSADINISDTALGSDTDYVKYKLSYNGYRAIGERNTLAWRLAGETVTGNPPFFAWPWYGSGVDLRGYTPGTYIGKSLLAAQAEWRWQATFRLGLVAFAGVGGSYGKVALFNQDNFLPAGGLGLRWRLTKQNRVNFRIDYAWGKDDEVLLISAGEAF